MKRVYIAKSNRANPNLVSAVRQTLSKFDVEIVEFTGGTYSHDLLLVCDELYVIPDLSDAYEDDDDDCSWSVSIGKGLYEQIKTFSKKDAHDNIFIVTDFDNELGVGGVHYDDDDDVISIEIYDDNDYINHALITINTARIDIASWELYDYVLESNNIKDKSWVGDILTEMNDGLKTWKGNETIQNWERKANSKKFMVLLAKR
jgi:hypothetical protein